MVSDVKGNRYIYVIIAIFLVLGLFLVLVNHYGNKALTGVRGYISGEAQWAKSQKQSVLELIQYIHHREVEYYDNYLSSLSVIMGDKQARITLSSGNPDYEKAYQGFKQGKIHPDEIGPVIWLFDHFQDFPYLKQAIGYWEEGDAKIEELLVIGAEVHERVTQGELSGPEKDRYLALLYDLDGELTVLENNFSDTMGEAAIFVSNLIYWSVLFIGLFLIFGGGFITVFYFRRVNRLNDLLLDTDAKFRTVLDNSRDVLYQMDPGGTRYEYMSRSVEQMLGIQAEKLMEEGPEYILDRIHPDDKDRLNRELEQFTSPDLEDQLKLDTEFRIKTQWGNYIWLNNKRSLLKDENGEPYGIVGNVRDITDRKKHLDQINKSLKEKETLLAEVHHRVKNNLAIISSLIELQKDGTDEMVSAEEVLQEIQTRIHSIALVHEKLYQSNTFAEINLAEYIEELTEFMSLAFDYKKRPVKVEKNLQSVKFDIIHAIPFGLLYNEIINNVYKHAFNGREDGIVKVNLKTEGDFGILAVADNGVGLPEDFSLDESGTLGMTLIGNLSTQLNGKIEVTNNGWTEFKFVFRLP